MSMPGMVHITHSIEGFHGRRQMKSVMAAVSSPRWKPGSILPTHNLDTIFQRYDGRCPSPGFRSRIRSRAGFRWS